MKFQTRVDIYMILSWGDGIHLMLHHPQCLIALHTLVNRCTHAVFVLKVFLGLGFTKNCRTGNIAIFYFLTYWVMLHWLVKNFVMHTNVYRKSFFKTNWLLYITDEVLKRKLWEIANLCKFSTVHNSNMDILSYACYTLKLPMCNKECLTNRWW